jgi:hypothetical protein
VTTDKIERANYEACVFKVFDVRESSQDNPPIPSFWGLVESGNR